MKFEKLTKKILGNEKLLTKWLDEAESWFKSAIIAGNHPERIQRYYEKALRDMEVVDSHLSSLSNLVSLDSEVLDADGYPVSLHETIGSDEETKKIITSASLKADLMKLLRNNKERLLIKLLLKGYTQTEVARLMGMSRQRVSYMLITIKKRVKKS